jgi:hypothetical protein
LAAGGAAPPPTPRDADALARFRAGAHRVGAEHPHILPTTSASTMDALHRHGLIAGKTLRAFAGAARPPASFVTAALMIAERRRRASRREADNIMVRTTAVKVVDFGLARRPRAPRSGR